jgi:hypothetical protein
MARPKGVKSIRDSAYNRNQIDLCRAKIETSKLISTLQANALQGKELDSVRQRSIEILLRKALPDLASVEQTVHQVQPFAVLPNEIKDIAQWESQATDPDTKH